MKKPHTASQTFDLASVCSSASDDAVPPPSGGMAGHCDDLPVGTYALSVEAPTLPDRMTVRHPSCNTISAATQIHYKDEPLPPRPMRYPHSVRFAGFAARSNALRSAAGGSRRTRVPRSEGSEARVVRFAASHTFFFQAGFSGIASKSVTPPDTPKSGKSGRGFLSGYRRLPKEGFGVGILHAQHRSKLTVTDIVDTLSIHYVAPEVVLGHHYGMWILRPPSASDTHAAEKRPASAPCTIRRSRIPIRVTVSAATSRAVSSASFPNRTVRRQLIPVQGDQKCGGVRSAAYESGNERPLKNVGTGYAPYEP